MAADSTDSIDPILTERVRTSRLLGADPAMVLHGGGNTSAKGEYVDLLGKRRACIWIKGSGWDLATIEAPGLPACDLEQLRALRVLEELSDEDMVREVRRTLLDPTSPTPSVEALLHAFLPHRFVDHSHADAILALSDREGGEELCREVFGDRVAYLPFVMPGFPLAKAVAAVVEEQPHVEGVLLHKHGLFTFGGSGEQSLQRHFEFVAMATERYEKERVALLTTEESAVANMRCWRASQVTPVLRGALAGDGRFVLETRAAAWIVAALEGDGVAEIMQSAPLTPDHSLRTKNQPCWLELPAHADRDPERADSGADGQALAVQQAVQTAVATYAKDYRAYFERGCASRGPRTALDPMPRVFYLRGYGLIGVGANAKAAAIAADLAEHTLLTKVASQQLGAFEGLSEMDLFDMEYWSLEQAKLGKAKAPELQGKVAVITGGGGAIGEGIARVLLDAGAAVALLDLELSLADDAAQRLGGAVMAVAANVTCADSMAAAMDQICERFGGMDIVVPNAGLAHVASLEELQLEDWQRLIDVNQTGVLLTIQAAAKVLRCQGAGGSVVLVSSKNVLAPGANFGAYSASKAGAHQLAKIAALELAEHGIHVNMVCPDAVFRCGDNPSGLWAEVGPDRAKSRGLSSAELEDFYQQRNLLKAEVTAEDVGRAVLFFAANRTPTTGAVLPVDGGVPGAFPR
ncbi:MAG: bifunctional aldolase/short-chain dehydrogenase [Planctomycetes bacterium]|nr:bifunctional aldolase/short-chain dehydrogenase [Planctomycetota bacterium]MCP4770904.1 bifunctional aldolase/short-chain dehydrogenase [Planctomycetota bacterium]MCP4862271.1 bifunctional aldolase/short-chain dehydrogenase [Planctomycetota bacterium]